MLLFTAIADINAYEASRENLVHHVNYTSKSHMSVFDVIIFAHVQSYTELL